jgi:flagellin
MGLRINTNVQSLAAQRNLGISNVAQRNSIEKLASGQRINRASDDAAGLAISKKMESTLRSVNQDVRNANDGISMIQTAEGAMNEIGNILVRFRELSIQAASDTVGEQERNFIDKEVQQLRLEVDRIAGATEFNGKKLLSSADGGEGTLELQVGYNNVPELDRFVFDRSKTDSTTTRLGVADITVSSKEAAQGNLTVIDDAIKTLSENRAELGALQNRLQSGISSLQVYHENLSAARSRIADVDMASETAELTKTNILSQAGVSVLSQANQNSMSALKLIG